MAKNLYCRILLMIAVLSLTACTFYLPAGNPDYVGGGSGGNTGNGGGNAVLPETDGGLIITGLDAYSGGGYFIVDVSGQGEGADSKNYYYAGTDLDISGLPNSVAVMFPVEITGGSVSLKVWKEGPRPDYLPVAFDGDTTILFKAKIDNESVDTDYLYGFGEVIAVLTGGVGTGSYNEAQAPPPVNP